MQGKKIKKRLIVLLVVVLAAAGILYGFIGNKKKYDFSHLIEKKVFEAGEAFSDLDSESPVKDFLVGAENETLKLLVNTETAEVAIEDKRSGDIWYTNPPDGADDPIALKSGKDRMASGFTITYYNEVREEMQMNSFVDSVEKLQFEIKSINDGIRIDYAIGNLSLGYLAVPDFIKMDRLQSLVLDHLDAKLAKKIGRYFVESREKEGFMQLNASARASNVMMDQILDAFYTQGVYTEAELAYDVADAGIELDLDKKYFQIPIEYTLRDDSLKVTIGADRIEEVGGIQIGTIDLLPFFGAGSMEDSGYLFVPSGSGAIIQFNNGKEQEKLPATGIRYRLSGA